MSSKKRGLFFLFFLLNICSVSAALLNPTDIGFGGQTLDSNYEILVNSIYSNSAVVTTVNGKLWVPWYSSSSSCQINNLHSGNNCNSGQTIDSTHNCMVTDEFSQVGMIVSMGKNQTRMNEYYNTVLAIRSNKGQLPAWRVYRNGNTFEACRSGINGNCDTASDADARIITSLFSASRNSYFSNSAQKAGYEGLALNLTRDFLQYEVLHSCKPSSLGQGDICYWLAAGAGAKSGGMGATDFAYTGYYHDAIVAMLAACSITGNNTYCDIADDFTLNYLEASRYNGQSFSVPPGRSFRWGNLGGVPQAECTHSCSPVVWDYADASRAVGICQANYYAGLINHTLPLLQRYCNQWGQQHMGNANSAPIQYYPNGQALNSQSGYFAQGLESLYQSGGYNRNLYRPTLISALNHYTPQTRTWDYGQCFGIYMPAFAVRSLGFGLGRDEAAFRPRSSNTNNNGNTSTSQGNSGNAQCYNSVENIPAVCNGGTITQDTYNGCRTIVCTSNGNSLRVLACNKPDNSNTQYFEMYRQQASGNLGICIGQTCISNNGFARSSNMPFCINGSSSGPGTNTTQSNSPTAPTNVTVPASNNTPSPNGNISAYPVMCSYSSGNCPKLADVTSGDCRTVVFGTISGPIQIQACKKPNNTIEVYRQNYPPSMSFSACLHTGCVNQYGGFASFHY